jgi:hypothetical protein
MSIKKKKKKKRGKGKEGKIPSTTLMVNTTPMHEQSPPYLDYAEIL